MCRLVLCVDHFSLSPCLCIVSVLETEIWYFIKTMIKSLPFYSTLNDANRNLRDSNNGFKTGMFNICSTVHCGSCPHGMVGVCNARVRVYLWVSLRKTFFLFVCFFLQADVESRVRASRSWAKFLRVRPSTRGFRRRLPTRPNPPARASPLHAA